MDIKEIYNQREELQLIVNMASNQLNTYDSKLSGLVPDNIRDTEEYKRDYKTYKQAFNNLQEFNKKLSGTQKRELRNIKRQLKYSLN